MIDEEAIARLEIQLGRLLFAGIMSAAACLAAGLGLWIAGVSSHLAHVLLTTGLIVLMVTPIARVIASMIVYVRMRDWFFVATTLLVFAVLIAAWLIKA
jgi:uncharacterized membrane protein